MEVSDTKYATITYNEDTDMIIHKWKYETIQMTQDSFREEMQRLVESFNKYKPKNVLVDQRDFMYTLLKDDQLWVDENVNKVLNELGCQKVAFVMSHDIMAKLTVDHTFEEEHSSKLNTRFFEFYKDALEWFNE